jgi:hypothetical protein
MMGDRLVVQVRDGSKADRSARLTISALLSVSTDVRTLLPVRTANRGSHAHLFSN